MVKNTSATAGDIGLIPDLGPGSPVVKNTSATAGDIGLIPDLGRLHKPQSN